MPKSLRRFVPIIAVTLMLMVSCLSSHSQTAAAGSQGALTLDAVIAMSNAGLSEEQLAQVIVDQPKPILLGPQDHTRLALAHLPLLVVIAVINPAAARVELSNRSTRRQGLSSAAVNNSQVATVVPDNQVVQPAPTAPRQAEPVEDTACFKSEPQIPIGDESNQPKISGGAKGLWSDFKHDMKEQMGGHSTLRTSYHSISGTRLSCFFARHPLANESSMWPRVAITFLHMPFNGRDVFMFAQTHNATCWKMRAVIWYSPSDSENIEPFQWCWKEGATGVEFREVDQWGDTPADNVPKTEINLGQRNDTSLIPATRMPTGPTLRGLFGVDSMNTMAVGNILYRMGVDWTHAFTNSDRRVWFNLSSDVI